MHEELSRSLALLLELTVFRNFFSQLLATGYTLSPPTALNSMVRF
jgi:hypothetical protein